MSKFGIVREDLTGFREKEEGGREEAKVGLVLPKDRMPLPPAGPTTVGQASQACNGDFPNLSLSFAADK